LFIGSSLAAMDVVRRYLTILPCLFSIRFPRTLFVKLTVENSYKYGRRNTCGWKTGCWNISSGFQCIGDVEGVYFYTLECKGINSDYYFKSTKHMLLIKWKQRYYWLLCFITVRPILRTGCTCLWTQDIVLTTLKTIMKVIGDKKSRLVSGFEYRIWTKRTCLEKRSISNTTILIGRSKTFSYFSLRVKYRPIQLEDYLLSHSSLHNIDIDVRIGKGENISYTIGPSHPGWTDHLLSINLCDWYE